MKFLLYREVVMKKWAIGSILIIFAFLPLLISQGQEKPSNSGKLYDSSMELFHKGKYQEAMEGFSKLIQSFPKSNLVSYSHYMIGQSLLKMGRYEEAIQKFEFYVKTYPDGDRLREAEKGIQISKEKLKEKREVVEAIAETKPVPEEPKKVEVPAIAEEPKKVEVKAPPEEPKINYLPGVKRVKRRICAQVFYFDAKNFEEVEKRVRELKNAGINTLILRVFQIKGDRIYKFVKPRHDEGVYFKTAYAPVVDDILGKIAEIARRNGIDLFAWITTRYADFGLEEHPEYRCKSYNFETKKMEVGRGFNLFHPDVLKRLEGLFRDLGRYPIDGILFQDDLILRHNEDFSIEANKAFLREFGFLPHPDIFYIDPYQSDSGKYYVKAYTDHFWTWANWKNRWLMDVTKRLMSSAKESNPNLQFGINLYYETVLNHSNAVAWFSQTLSEALKKNFDYYAIMAYHRQTMKELNMEEKKVFDLMAEVSQKAVEYVGDPSKVLIKVQILDWKNYEVIPQKEVEEILSRILEQGEVSLAFVPYIHQFPLHQLKGKWTDSK
jgi:tetratricopeptide (TPR) repeat protein